MTTNANKYLIGNRFIFVPIDNSLIDTFKKNELTRLGSNESRALSLLIEDPSLIITRQRMHDYVWREQGFEVDDSSLTQAISTLRKALKDSTKSPEFIKTVPKRGYQMIASVDDYICPQPEKYKTIINEDNDNKLNSKNTISVNEIVTCTQQDDLLTKVPPADQHKDNAINTIANKPTFISWKGWLALIIALLLPIIVNISMPPKSAAFISLFDVNGIPVYAPNDNPQIKHWHEMIKSCITCYLNNHNQKDQQPSEIIVTGGQNNQLYLNYLHNSNMPTENETVRLLTSHKDHSSLCR